MEYPIYGNGAGVQISFDFSQEEANEALDASKTSRDLLDYRYTVSLPSLLPSRVRGYFLRYRDGSCEVRTTPYAIPVEVFKRYV